MGFPCLVPKWALNADVTGKIASNGVNEDGEIILDFEFEAKCNLQLFSGQQLNTKKEQVRTTGKAYFQGDICPDIREIASGTLTHNGVTYSINGGSKALNFDGSVNYTVLELM